MSKRVDCFVCGKGDLAHNEIGLNKKMIGRNIEKFHCMDCLAEYLDISVDDLMERIEEFKAGGCALFK